MFKKISAMFLLAAATLITGCASIVNGTNQSVSVHTTPIGGATCSLENDKGRWYLPTTPGSVVVHRSFNDLRINCHKPGFRPTYTQIASKTKAMAFGNIVFGGVIGAGVDVVDGAAYDYPTDIFVPLSRA